MATKYKCDVCRGEATGHNYIADKFSGTEQEIEVVLAVGQEDDLTGWSITTFEDIHVCESCLRRKAWAMGLPEKENNDSQA